MIRIRWTALAVLTLLAALALAAPAARAQAPDAAVIHIANSYRLQAGITYETIDGVENKLDVYQSRAGDSPKPTLVFIHGGNWVGGSRAASSLFFLPFLEMGWNVVNIDYRLLGTAPAPAGADDCFCAVRWAIQHAKDYNIDPSRIVLSGNSAGGHLALLVAMAPPSAGFGSTCPQPADLHVAGVINWYGFSDLVDLLDGPNTRPAAVNWIGQGPDRLALARRLSPTTYVARNVPAILTIQGDADPTSPYEYTVQFHDTLAKAGVVNKLMTIPNGKHGGFSDAETEQIYGVIRTFLDAHVLNGR